MQSVTNIYDQANLIPQFQPEAWKCACYRSAFQNWTESALMAFPLHSAEFFVFRGLHK